MGSGTAVVVFSLVGKCPVGGKVIVGVKGGMPVPSRGTSSERATYRSCKDQGGLRKAKVQS